MTQASNPDIEKIAKPGDIVAGKYLVDRVLGVGGMGAVVAATHTQLDQRVAIKFLLPQMLGSREVVERFQREARAAAKIRSEHVVRVSDVGTLDGGVPFIVMEFLEGKDLGELLQRRGPLPVPLAVDYVLEACEALAEAHAAGIVHRDLKPSNLFLARRADETDIVKVLDFGISKQITPEALQSSPSLTRTTDVFGSPTYMSPEQLKASRDVDTRADLWALGVILFELISGAPPFGGGTVAEIFGAILHKPAPRIRETRKDVPEPLERVLLRCLEKEADSRHRNVAELAEALLPFGSDAARESSARISRVLRASIPGARASLPDFDPPRGSPAVQASTDPSANKPSADADKPSPGGATATSWGHVQPAPRATSTGRIAVIALAVLLAAGAGVLIARSLGTSPGPTAATPGVTAPTGDVSASPAAPTTVVIPAPSGALSESPTSTAAAPSAEAPSVTPAPTTTAAPKISGTLLPKASPAVTATATAQPPTATAQTTTPEPPKPPPTTGGDDEFGGRR
ncbi:MAG: protein kinase [Polyangiaceae bacterium]